MTIVETRPVTGGVDTHLDTHVAAAVDANGGVLGVESFATTPAGLVELHDWLAGFGDLQRVGVEGTGAYGAGLARHLRGLTGLRWQRVDLEAHALHVLEGGHGYRVATGARLRLRPIATELGRGLVHGDFDPAGRETEQQSRHA